MKKTFEIREGKKSYGPYKRRIEACKERNRLAESSPDKQFRIVKLGGRLASNNVSQAN